LVCKTLILFLLQNTFKSSSISILFFKKDIPFSSIQGKTTVLISYFASLNTAIDRVFVHALHTVKKLPRTGTSRPPPEDRLKLYGLYKQSMEGDVSGVMNRPEGMSEESVAERNKW